MSVSHFNGDTEKPERQELNYSNFHIFKMVDLGYNDEDSYTNSLN